MFQANIHYSEEIETAVIGICLLEKSAFGRTYGLVEEKNFYREANKIIYKAMTQMYKMSLPIDLLTVGDYLFNKENKTHLDSGETAYATPYYLMKTTSYVCSSAHVEYHCHIIKRMWMERELINLTHGGIKLEGAVGEQVSQLNRAIQQINQGTYVKDWVDMSDVMYNLVIHQEEMSKNAGMGITTGNSRLDRENGGFYPGQMIVIGARPSVGKSAYMGQMAMSIAKTGKKVGIISLEMNNNEIGARLSSLGSDDDFRTIFRNLYRDEDHKAKWYQKIQDLIELPIFITDKTDVSPTSIKAKAIKLQHSEGLDILMIDYLQLVNSENDTKNRTRENEVSQLSRACKLLAKDLGIPVIVLCQLNRAITGRTGVNRYPQLSDLRESGSIEQDADVVMFIHRDWMLGEAFAKDENGNSTEFKADLVVRKWRNGAANLHIDLGFNPTKMMFYELNGDNMNYWKPETENYQNDNPF
jgi:replicative DNA helicase